jgi:ADP-heptose:LPS heptosyltransferase
LVDYIQKHVPESPKIVDFVGKTTIKESIALASLCDCVFGVDTGMQHIAAAVGARTVSVFGPTNFRTHGAYSDGAKFLVNNNCCPTQYCYGTSHYVNCPENRKCLTSISPEQAFVAVKDMLFDKQRM